LLFSIHPREYRFICLLFSTHTAEYSFIFVCYLQMYHKTRGIQLYLFVNLNAHRVIQLHFLLFFMHPGDYNTIYLSFSIHTGDYNTIYLSFSIHTGEYTPFLALFAKGKVSFSHYLVSVVSSVNFWHFDIFLWNPSAKWTETW
jgi:hypothetical protein